MEGIIKNIHLNNELFSVLVFIFCSLTLIKILHKAHRNQLLDWSDLLTINGPSNKVSFPKLIQLIATFTSTWAMIHITLFSQLTSDILGVYLAFSGGNEAFSKYIAFKKEFIEHEKKC